MGLGDQIAKNTLIQWVAKISTTATGVLVFAVMARYLGQEGFGQFTTITAFLQFFGIIADMGLSIVAIQMLSEVGTNSRRAYANIITFRVITAAILLSLAPLAALFFPYPPIVKWGITIMAVSQFLNSMIQLLTVPFQVNFRMTTPLIAEIAGRILLIAGIIWVAARGGTLSDILIVIVINNIIPAAILFYYARRYVPLHFAWDPAIIRNVITRSWPIALSIMLNLVYLRTDIIFLSLLRPTADVGLYGAAYRVIDVLTQFPTMFMGIALGSFSAAWSRGDTQSFGRYFQKSFDFVVLAAIPMVLTTLFLGEPIMRLIAGAEFEQAGNILRILIIAAGTVFIASIFTYLINVINAQRAMIFGYAIAAVIGLGGYLLFIPRAGYWGAAWVTVASEAVVLIIAAGIFLWRTKIQISFTRTIKGLLAAIAPCTFLASPLDLHVLLSLACALALYATTLWLLGGLPDEVARHLPRRVRRA